MVRDKIELTPGIKTDSAKHTADYNWQISGDKSFTKCLNNSIGAACPVSEDEASLEERMKSGINMHWYRNFKTDDLAGYDFQLDGETDQGETKEIFAFFWNWEGTSFNSNLTPSSECLSDFKVDVTPVTEQAWAQVYQDPALEPAPEPTTDP